MSRSGYNNDIGFDPEVTLKSDSTIPAEAKQAYDFMRGGSSNN